MRYEAIELFVERARSRLAAFSLTGENAGTVAEVCRKLDGIPLAIELAAARVPVLSVKQISERLKDPLGFLTAGDRTTAPRQRTLRATLAWSYEMLEETEQRLFGRLSVFAGGWTLEAAEAVGASEGIEKGDVLDLLSGLVDKSLVVVEASQGAEDALRYRMLEPVRQYGLERLEESREAERVQERHARHCLALAEKAEPELRGPEQLAWLERLETEHGNLAAALSWTLDSQDARPKGRAELGLRLAAALWKFWDSRSHVSEGRRWLERGLSESVDAAARAKALNGLGWMSTVQGDGQAIALLEESLALFKELKYEAGIATSLGHLGVAVVYLQIDKWRLSALREEAEALRREPLSRWATARLLTFLAMAAMDEGDYERAAALAEKNLTLNRELGDLQGTNEALIILGTIASIRGDHERAAAAFEEALRLLQKLGDTESVIHCLLGLAWLAAPRGEPVRAARLWGAAEAQQEATGSVADSPFIRSQYDYESLPAAARSRLDEAAWEAAWAEGRAMTPDQAVEYALGEALLADAPSPAATAAPRKPTPDINRPLPEPLTDRELEVLALISAGLSNRQIAARLFIVVSTVKTYVNTLFKKLGVQSRTQAIAQARRLGFVSEE